jgi:hypothetical protein
MGFRGKIMLTQAGTFSRKARFHYRETPAKKYFPIVSWQADKVLFKRPSAAKIV